ncbi:MAG: OmpA family protein, partial [Gammaproteobacteria bacterium]
MSAKPLLDDIELRLVQKIEAEDEETLAQHGVPALEGDFLQDQGRRAGRISLTGVMAGEDVADVLNKLREKFRSAEPVPFVADIATATNVGKVLIEELGIRDLAGKPERFEYALTLREFIPPPPTRREAPPPPPPPPPPPAVETATLIVEVIVEGDPDFDFSTVTLTLDGTQDDGAPLSRTLTNRENNIWTEAELPPGRYTARAAVISPQPMSGSAQVELRAGQTVRSQITLQTGTVIATTFRVHFRFDNAFLEPCMREVMRQVAQHAANNTDQKLLIVGHTDKTGPPRYNQSLSERRARSVYAYLSFGRDRTEALNEWNALRVRRQPSNQLPSVADNWDVREYQHILQDLGFYPGAVDGQDGPLTRDAVSAYRCRKGLPAGTTVDDEVWNELIQDYLGQDSLNIPANQFHPNCTNEILKWLGCGEEDPVNNTPAAHRPNRRTELLFVSADRLPCQVPQPDTFNLPGTPTVNANWCVGPGASNAHCCIVSPHLQRGTNKPQPCSTDPQGPWCRQPAEPGTITVKGSIQRELPDGTLEPVPNQAFVLIASNGQFKAGEQSNGEPTPARTKGTGTDRGTFSFPKMPLGFYSLEVKTPASAPVLVRLRDGSDADVKGNAVCKALRADGDHLDVVIVNAPVLREIRLPVAVHLMTALHPVTREVRQCTAGGRPERQATAVTNVEVRAAFDEANRIWRQARIRFELEDADIVRETYVFRTDCEVDESEFTILLERCAYPDVVNVFFVGDLGGQGEAGFGVSPEGGAALGVAGCAVGDRFQTTILGPPLSLALDAEQRAQVLAHELGHFLNLEHADDTPANANRLMATGTFSGANRVLIQDEVNRARASRGATDTCVPLKLHVNGATQIGGNLSHEFIVIQNPTGVVTVDAEIPARMLDPARGTLSMTGGTPGATPLQRLVSAAATATTEVTATYTPAGGGSPITKRVVVRVATFSLDVDGAIPPIISAGPGIFEAILTPEAEVKIIARINQAPFCMPNELVSWSAGTPLDDPLQRIVSAVAVGETTVQVTLATVTRRVVIRFVDPALPGSFAVGEHEYGPAQEGNFTVPGLTEILGEESQLDMGSSAPITFSSFSVARRALVRYPADTNGVDRPVSNRSARYPLVILAHGNHRARYNDSANTRVENFRGLQYLARHLASHGYIAVSVDLDEINLPINRDPAILQRAHVVLDHIDVMARRDASGPLFTGKIDLSRIGLIGHSRGGETVVAAQRVNLDEGRGRQIKSIVSIAPTDFLGLTQSTTPYCVIYGSADGDVSIGWPFRLYDRMSPFKSMLFAYGAIHNFFSEHPDWRGLIDPRVAGPYTPRSPDSADPRRISFDNHQNIARGYCLGFIEKTLRGHPGYDRLFKREG